MGWWETAVQYQMWHAVALVAIAALPMRRTGLAAACLALGAGIFSGTLYVMALTGFRWLGMITPLGGILMIAGWLLLAWRGFFPRRSWDRALRAPGRCCWRGSPRSRQAPGRHPHSARARCVRPF